MTPLNNASHDATINDLGLGKSAPKATKDSSELGQDEFLKLMVAQLKNQDPFKPLENGDFIAQMAQFSSVSGLQQLQTSFDGLATSMQSSQALQASTLVGRNVAMSTENIAFDGTSDVSGFVRLPTNSENVTFRLFDKGSGELVREIYLGAKNQGDLQFAWDGKDGSGQVVPKGDYVMSAEASTGETNTALGTYLYARVDSVTLGQQAGGVTLNLMDQGSVSLSEVEEIR